MGDNVPWHMRPDSTTALVGVSMRTIGALGASTVKVVVVDVLPSDEPLDVAQRGHTNSLTQYTGYDHRMARWVEFRGHHYSTCGLAGAPWRQG